MSDKQFQDKHGTPLKVGDEVMMRITIEHLVDGEGDLDSFVSHFGISFCTKACEKVEPAEDAKLEEQCLTAFLHGDPAPGEKKGRISNDDSHITFEDDLSEARRLLASAYKEISGKIIHASDCATSNAPAMLPGRCDCELAEDAAPGEKKGMSWEETKVAMFRAGVNELKVRRANRLGYISLLYHERLLTDEDKAATDWEIV